MGSARALEFCHLPVGVCLPLLPLQACLLSLELPQLPLGSRQLLLQLGCCHAVPASIPSEGLLDAPDVSLGPLNLLLGLEELQAQGLLGTLAGMVHVLVFSPSGRIHPNLWSPRSLALQLFIQEIKYVPWGQAAPRPALPPPAPLGPVGTSLHPLGPLLQDLCTLV